VTIVASGSSSRSSEIERPSTVSVDDLVKAKVRSDSNMHWPVIRRTISCPASLRTVEVSKS